MKVLLTLYGEERGPQDFTPEQSAAEMAAWRPMISCSSSVMSRANDGRGALSLNTKVLT